MADFSSDDHNAAVAWLANPTNSSFDEYTKATADNAKAWEGLERKLKLVTGQPNFMVWVKDAVAEHMDTTQLKQHMTGAQHKIIADDAFKSIFAAAQVSWKEQSRTWIQKAIYVIIPRANTLWKKGVRKAASSVKSNDETILRSKNLQPKPSKKPNKSLSLAKRPAEEVEEEKKYHAKRVRSDREVVYMPQCVQHQSSLFLVDRNIEVEYLGLKPEADARRILVGISAIISDDYLTRMHQDIRSDHLDYTKFQKLLTIQEPEINFEHFRYEWSTPSQAFVGQTEEEFRLVIGLEIKDLEREKSRRDVKIILRKIGEQ